MNDQPVHLLNQMGVLSSFSISKKITEEEINLMMKRAKVKSKNENEILELIKRKIMKEIIDATKKGTVPGVILEKSENYIVPLKIIEPLNNMVDVLSRKLKAKKLDQLSLCYFINYLVGSLGLTEEDFEEFHRRLKESQDDDDENEEE